MKFKSIAILLFLAVLIEQCSSQGNTQLQAIETSPGSSDNPSNGIAEESLKQIQDLDISTATPDTINQAISSIQEMQLTTTEQKAEAQKIVTELTKLSATKEIESQAKALDVPTLSTTSTPITKEETKQKLARLKALVEQNNLTESEQQELDKCLASIKTAEIDTKTIENNIDTIRKAIKQKEGLAKDLEILTLTSKARATGRLAIDKEVRLYNTSYTTKIKMLEQTTERLDNAADNLIAMIDLDKTTKKHQKSFFQIIASEADQLKDKVKKVEKNTKASIAKSKERVEKKITEMELLGNTTAEIKEQILAIDNSKSEEEKKKLASQRAKLADNLKEAMYAQTEAKITLNAAINDHKEVVEDAIREYRSLYNDAADFYKIDKENTKQQIANFIASL